MPSGPGFHARMCKAEWKPHYTFWFPRTLAGMRHLLLLACLCLLSAAEGEGEPLGGKDLELRGSGRLTWMWMDIYDVELRTPHGAVPDPALQPCHLTFRYRRAFTAADLAKATTTTIRERTRTADRDAVEPGLAAINALWPAVAEGDVLELIAGPGLGTTLRHNGRELGKVPGDRFASALFSIWLGDDPVDAGLKRKLLSRP